MCWRKEGCSVTSTYLSPFLFKRVRRHLGLCVRGSWPPTWWELRLPRGFPDFTFRGLNFTTEGIVFICTQSQVLKHLKQKSYFKNELFVCQCCVLAVPLHVY